MGLVRSMTAALKSRRAAQSEVTRLEQKIVDLRGEAEGKRQELAALEASVGERVLADPSSARTLAVDAQELRFLIDGAQAASEAAERQLREARWELSLAQAAEKRQEAVRLTAEADAHQAKVDELLRQLTELDGAEYRPYEPDHHEREMLIVQFGRAEWTPPKASILLRPVDGLIAEAVALEQRVAAERADLAEQTSPVEGRGGITLPADGDIYTDTRVGLFLNRGVGSAVFELVVNGHVERSVTLPDEAGNRRYGCKVWVRPGGGQIEVRCNGQVIAHERRPGVLLGSPSGGYVQIEGAR